MSDYKNMPNAERDSAAPKTVEELRASARAMEDHANALEAEGRDLETSDSSSDTDDKLDFGPNPAMDAAIEAKIKAAADRGIDLEAYLDMPEGPEKDAITDGLGLTVEEKRYTAGLEVMKQVRIVFGQKAFEALQKSDFPVEREDLIPCLTAYFEALDNGEIEAV